MSGATWWPPGDPPRPGRPDRPGPPDRPGWPGPVPPVPPRVPPTPVVPPVPMVDMPDERGPLEGLRSRLYDQLLSRRTVVLEGPLDGSLATVVAAQLMTLDAEGTDPVTLVVNSPGGPVEDAATVLDTLDLVRGPVTTHGIGQAGGTAAVVLAAGTGRRRLGPSAHVRLRLPDVEVAGDARRLADAVADHRRLHDALVDRLARATGQERRLVARDVDRGRMLTAEEAVAYGLVDEVAGPSPG